MKLRLFILFAVCATPFAFIDTAAQNKQPPKKEVIPHAQDKPPGPALSPQEAIKKMQVPPGFHVELVAAEPDIVNPVAMTFDERGRIWITESLEYPKKAAGPGKDRVKVLESTKGDGKFDKVSTVIDGLNIPSGIAVGHGGVWVCNAPDILFYPFVDFAGAKLGKPQVVVTGFGRFDTHELPNSLTWGPDGWLYGLNGVFNRSVIKQDGKTFDFTCALFRIHPKTKKFEIFCEGTSNPWGLAFNDNGDAFVSACVIDHLWHLTETGYYHRQGGAYPPFTWKIGSIVKHKHQKAAYCGLCWFDSDAYPPEYREKMYMGNIHGGCINVDQLEKDGSTYAAKPGLLPSPPGRGAGGEGGGLGLPQEPTGAKRGGAIGVGPGSNFLMANDAWFMPVAQKVGPDGCLYILDWYDRYHCYQDANRDPAGIDRLKGRLYRVVYKDYKPAGKFDLGQGLHGYDYPTRVKNAVSLVNRLNSPNIYFRETAQLLLLEHCWREFENANTTVKALGTPGALQIYVFHQATPRKARLHALQVLAGADMFDDVFLKALLDHKDPTFRAWGVRIGGRRNMYYRDGRFVGWIDDRGAFEKILAHAKDPSPEVQLQVAIAARTLKEYREGKPGSWVVPIDAMPVLLDVLAHCGDEKLIPHIVWQNLHPLLEKDGERFLALAGKVDLAKSPGVAKVLPRAIDRILGNTSGDPAAVIAFIEKLTTANKSDTAKLCLAGLAVKIQNNEITGKQLDSIKKGLLPSLVALADPKKKHPLANEAVLFGAVLREEEFLRRARTIFVCGAGGDLSGPAEHSLRLRAFEALVSARHDDVPDLVHEALNTPDRFSLVLRGNVLQAVSRSEEARVAKMVLSIYTLLEPELQTKAIELLTQRSTWAKLLFAEIARERISRDVVNVNQARRLLGVKDAELTKLVEKHWGIPRDSRNPEREKLAAQMKELFAKTPGDPKAGMPIFKKLCAQCHKMHGEGVDVGPDITLNGRSDFDQLLSNIFDPSLVIGAGYQAVTVNTKQGQVISGLVVEDNAQRIVLKVQGGELKTVPRADVDEKFTSKLSMMPEDVERQLRPQEIVDLLSYLSLDRPPSDPKARKIPGTPR